MGAYCAPRPVMVATASRVWRLSVALRGLIYVGHGELLLLVADADGRALTRLL